MTKSSRRARRLAVVAIAALGTLAVRDLPAVTFPNLYTVAVGIDRLDPAATDRRAAAARLGMVQLLERITGRTNAGEDPELAHIVRDSARYVNSYGLLDRERVQVGFISSEVDRALTAAGWPVWGAERPMTLLWVAVDGGNGERGLLSESFDASQWSPEMASLMQSLEQQIRDAANMRGLPITLPLLDLEDLQQIGFADVWGGFDERVESASLRYGADAYLLAQVRSSAFGFDVRWTLVQGGRRRVRLSTAIEDGIDWVAEEYASDYSVVGGNRTLRLTVHDVRSLTDYGRVMSYLESVSLLASVDVEGFDGTELNLRLAARGDDAVLERVLALGGVLARAAPTTPPRPGALAGDAMHFEVVRAGLRQ